LDKKEKHDQGKVFEDKKKKDGNDTDKILVNDLQREAQISQSGEVYPNKKENENNIHSNQDNENDSEKSEDPFDLTKDYDKVFNFNLITDEEKDEFRKGKPLPFLKNNLLKVTKAFMGQSPQPLQSLPMQEQYRFQLISFRFKDASLMRCPKIHFQENASLFDNMPDDYSIFSNNNKNYNKATTINSQHLSKKGFSKFKSPRNQHNSVYDSNSSKSSDDEKKNKEKSKEKINEQ
jgi:hypothetical protein